MAVLAHRYLLVDSYGSNEFVRRLEVNNTSVQYHFARVL